MDGGAWGAPGWACACKGKPGAAKGRVALRKGNADGQCAPIPSRKRCFSSCARAVTSGTTFLCPRAGSQKLLARAARPAGAEGCPPSRSSPVTGAAAAESPLLGGSASCSRRSTASLRCLW